MFYVMNEDTLSIFDDSKEKIEATREFMPQLTGQLTLETGDVTASELELHPNKVIVGDVPVEIDVPDCEEIEEEYQEQVIDEEGNPVYDEEGNPVYETKTRIVLKPIMIEVEDEDGNIILVPSTHKETIYVKGIVLNPNYDKEEEDKEQERISKLSLTRREVFLALYKDKGLVPDVLREGLKNNPEALIEFDYAERYYRGNPLIDIIGASLGYSKDDMDYLFINKEFRTNKGEE